MMKTTSHKRNCRGSGFVQVPRCGHRPCNNTRPALRTSPPFAFAAISDAALVRSCRKCFAALQLMSSNPSINQVSIALRENPGSRQRPEIKGFSALCDARCF